MNYTTSSLVSLAAAAALACYARVLDGGAGTSAIRPECSAAVSRSAARPAAAQLGERSLAPADFGPAIGRLSAAVVGISAVNIISLEPDDSDAGDGEGVLAEPQRHGRSPASRAKPARLALRDQGSGIVVARDGYILTAAHVVDDAAVVTVQLQDGREFPAKIVGADLRTDVAVLKIRAADLSAATLCPSSRLRVGTWVAAIGAPFGFRGSVAVGVVSALERRLPGDDSYMPFIQTDLPLNPGNSGGPLLNAEGEVVGINSQVALSATGESGVSFAIPIEIARQVEAQLIRAGRVEQGDLGIAFQDVDTSLARAFGLDTATGALVHTVQAGGPASRANLRIGDIIVELDGRRVERASQLADAIAAHKPGSTTVVGIWRAHRLVHIPVYVKEAETFASEPSGSMRDFDLPELSVAELSRKERRALPTNGRLLVTGVSAQAAAAGIELGDVILGTANTPLRSVGELSRALADGSGELPLLIERERMRTFVALPLDVPQVEPTDASRTAGAHTSPTYPLQ